MTIEKIKRFTILIFITLLFLKVGYCQENVRSIINVLTELDYAQLENKYNDLNDDIIQKKIYAIVYIKKAKKENDIEKQANGYNMMYLISEEKDRLAYLDSIIDITKNSPGYQYPAEANILKAGTLGGAGRYREAMEELVIANKYALENENLDQQNRIKYFIALLKNNLGEYDESLQIFKSVKEYYHEKYVGDNSIISKREYLQSLYALGDSYVRNKKYDSAYYQNKKGIKLSLNSKDSLLYGQLLLLSGIIHYNTENYQSSLDSLIKFKSLFRNSDSEIKEIDLTEGDFYIGKVYFKQNKIDRSIEYLKRVDSITFQQNHFFPDLRPTYEVLIECFKKKKNTEKQLFYINRLLKFDSISRKDIGHLYKTMNEEYSTPNLMLEKQKIIDSLQQNVKSRIFIIIGLSVLSLLLLLFLVRNNKKRRIYKLRFEKMFNETKKENVVKEEPKKEAKDIGISQVVVDDILNGIKKFEDSMGFLKPNITVGALSKKINTNSKYLSKVVHSSRNKSFNAYINDLRINYAIEKLKTDKKFRQYTIKAIAIECGFNTAEAFSKYFYKTTGIYPSFFLKQLEKKESVA